MRLKVEPDVVALGPGDVTDLLVRVHNDGEDTCTPHLQVRGVDPDDVLLPDEVVAVPAGSVMTAIVRVRAAADAIPGDRRIAVAVEDLEGSQSTVSATTVLRIGARPDVAVEVDPVATAGRRGAKASTVLRNRSDRRLQIELEGRGDGVLVSFRPSRVTLDPGETKRVRTRMRRAQRSWFGEIRHGAVVTARGVGLPASTTATFTQKPSVPRPAVRGVAALTALAVWVAATVVVFNRINAEPEAGPDTGVAAGPAAPGPGRTSATGMFEDDAEEGIRLPVVIQGTVEGPRDPSGTTLTAERIGFGDQGTTTGFTKVVALTEVNLPRGNVLDVVRTTTDERGRFRIASGLVEDAFYRVTAVRAGFEVGSFIVSTSSDQPEVTLAIALEPATGSLGGLVTDTTGAPVGEAEVLVTDGSAEYTAVTPSEGDEAGRWVLEGLATPATYQVIVSRRGFASQTLIVDLDGGQQRSGVDAVLSADLGTIVGRVVDANPDPDQRGVAQGVGALTVTLAGPEARETRTLTVAGDLRGTFDLPGLPFGDYTVTFSGDGWVTRQAEVTVDRGLVRLDASINRSTGVVQGWVWQTATGPDAFQGECRYPRVEQRDGGPGFALADPRPRPCGGVSVSITSDGGDVFATASATDTGFFQIGGVPAGEYTLTLSRPGYVSDVRSIVVQPGGTFRLNPDRTAAVLDVTEAEPFTDFIPLELAAPAPVCIGTVVLTLIDVFSGGAAPEVDASGTALITVSGAGECEPQPTATRIGTSAAYRIDNVPLGPRRITVGDESDPAWPYAETALDVQVSTDSLATVTASLLPRPRALVLEAGAVELVGPADAQRVVRVQVVDKDDEVVAESAAPLTLGGSSSSVNDGPIAFDPLPPATDYRIRVVGPTPGTFPGFATTESVKFDIPVGGATFEIGPSDDALPVNVTAQTRLSGTVLGVSADTTGIAPLSGAKVTIPGIADPVEVDAADGTFVVDVDSATYGATDGPEPITVSAPGYVTRSFLPAPGRELIDPEAVLRPAGAATFALYTALSRSGAPAGDVGLDPATRSVTIGATLLGGTGATRGFHFELRGGAVAGQAVRAADGTLAETIKVSAQTLTAGDAKTFDLGEVPVGTYTVHAVPANDDRIALRGMTGTSGDADITGSGPTFTLVVPPGEDPIVLSATVRARTLVEGKVFGFDLSPLKVSELAGATVTVPSSGSGATEVRGGTVTTGDGSSAGSFSFEVDSGDYEEGGLGGITISADAYATRTLSGPLANNVAALPGIGTLFLLYPDLDDEPDGDVGLDPTPRDGTVSVDLSAFGGATVSRSVSVRLTGGAIAGQTITGDFVATPGDGAPSGELTTGTTGTFAFSGVPVGDYTLKISGDHVHDVTIDVTIGPDTGDFTLDAQSIVATTTVTGTIFEFDDLDSAFNIVPADTGTEVVFPTGSDPTDPGSAITVNVGSDGAFTAVVRSADYRADGLGEVVVEPADSRHQSRSFGLVLDDEVMALRQPGVAAFLLNPGLTGTGSDDGDIVLNPTTRSVNVDVTLLGADDATREMTVTLTDGTMGDATTPVDAEPATDPAHPDEVEVADETPSTFGFVDVRPGTYTLTISGDHIRDIETGVIIGLGEGSVPVSRDVQATVTVTGTLEEPATTGSDGTRDADEELPVVGATVTGPGGVSDTSDDAGAFTVVLDSGTSPELTIVATGFAEATSEVAVGASPEQDVGPFTLTRDAGIRIEGAISDNVTRVVASATDETSITVTPTGEDGSRRYAFDGLATGKEWEIEFVVAPLEPGGPERFVRRYVLSTTPIAIDLDQDTGDAKIGDLTVTVEIAEHPDGGGNVPSWVRIELIEIVPSAFFSVPGGSITVWKQRPASATDGLYTVSHTFEDLPDPASSRSLPDERFEIVVTLVTAENSGDAWTTTRYRATTSGGWEAKDTAPAATLSDLDPGDPVAALRFQTVPGVPESLTAIAIPQEGPGDIQQILVTWDPPAVDGGAASLEYRVEFGISGSESFASIVVGTAEEVLLNNLLPGAEYEIRVIARNLDFGAGADGEGEAAETTATTADVPTEPTVDSVVSESDSQLTVAFTPGGDGGSAITNYEYSIDNGATWTVRTPAATTSPLVITGLTNGTEYQVRIRAVNTVGPSPESNMVLGTPLPPLLTGGTITTFTDTDGTEYRVHTFDSVGTFTLGVTRSGPVEFLVVGGGGGGGNAYDGGPGGGGGAGGFREGTVFVGPTGLSGIVGAGGVGGAADNSQKPGSPGGPSSLGDIIAAGGGAGGGSRGVGGGGGSGGGAGGRPLGDERLGGAGNVPATEPPQGNKGGDNVGNLADNAAKGGGGGGGAGGPGGSSDTQAGGVAGEGRSSEFAGGTAVTYASGGAGGSSEITVKGADATVVGGGGGGASATRGNAAAGGSGQVGIVIVRYRVAASGS